MRYRIEFLPSANRQLAALPSEVCKRVADAIDRLATDPRPPGAKALRGSAKGLLCLRVGDYRVVYRVQDEVLVVLIVTVGHRRTVYRRIRGLR